MRYIKGKTISICFFTVVGLILVFSNFNNIESQKKVSFFDEVISSTSGCITENGITTSFYKENLKEEDFLNFIENFLQTSDYKISKLQNSNLLYFEFGHNNLSGTIQKNKEKSKEYITISIICNTENNNINTLKKYLSENINKYLFVDTKDIIMFKYVKAKLQDKNLDEYNDKILEVIKENGGENIDNIGIYNGYSITFSDKNAVTKEDMNLHCVICKYYSGNYLILGTPEILTIY